MQTVVLPVLRSPMISSRWPRPIGVIESMDLMPVCKGSCTGWRPMMPGAWISMRAVVGVDERTRAVDRLAEGVDDPAEQAVADRHREDAARGLDRLALFDAAERLAEHDGADRLLVEVQGEAERAVLELEQLVHRRRREAPTRGRCRRRPRGCARPGARQSGLKPARFFSRAAVMSAVLMVSSAMRCSCS